jgi:hypothetical protein
LGKGVDRKKKIAAATMNKKTVRVVKIKNFGGVVYFITAEYRRFRLFVYILECYGINTISEMFRRGAVVKDVAEMGVAPAAEHFIPFEGEAPILQVIDIFFGNRLFKAWIAIAGIVFFFPLEKGQRAGGARVDALSLRIGILADIGMFSPFLAHDVVTVLA